MSRQSKQCHLTSGGVFDPPRCGLRGIGDIRDSSVDDRARPSDVNSMHQRTLATDSAAVRTRVRDQAGAVLAIDLTVRGAKPAALRPRLARYANW